MNESPFATAASNVSGVSSVLETGTAVVANRRNDEHKREKGMLKSCIVGGPALGGLKER